MADLNDPAGAFDALIEGVSDIEHDTLLEVGHAAIALVVARTRHGVDVDGAQFRPYTPAYARARVRASLSTKPDLVRTGHMVGGMIPVVTGKDEVSITFPSDLEAIKATVHNDGCNKLVNVRAHSKNAYLTNKDHRRVSKQEYQKDRRNKTKKVRKVTESVPDHQRQMNIPKREFLDVRQAREVQFLADVAGEAMARRIMERLK